MALADILLRGARNARVPQSFAPLLQQAISEAAVRYEPEYDQLNQLRQQSAGTLRSRTSQANSAAQLISALANQTQRTVNSSANPLAARLSAYENPPAGSSSAVVAQSLGLTNQATNSLLGQAALNAPIRAQQQGLQALAEHQSDLDKINSQRSGLVGQAGTYITGRYSDLVGTDRKNRADVNAQKRDLAAGFAKAGVTPEGQVIPGGAKDPAITHPPKPPEKPSTIAKPPANYPGSAADWNNASRADRERWMKNHPTSKSGSPGGIKPATPGQHGSLKDRISYGISVAKTHKASGDPRNLTAQILTEGVPAFSAPGGGKIPAIKALPQLSASIALDIAYDGHVSRKNVVELHKRGYSLAQLGFPTKAQPKVRLPVGGSVPLPS